MPQSRPELHAKFGDDGTAWNVLATNFQEDKFLIYPLVLGYTPTQDELDAIEYLCDEWDWAYDPAYKDPAREAAQVQEAEHDRKMKVVHAVWLVAFMNQNKLGVVERRLDADVVMHDTAAMLGVKVDDLFVGFDRDYLDRAWCSRPPDWKPTDSLA